MVSPMEADGELHKPVSAVLDNQTGFLLVHLDKVDYGFMDQLVRYQGRVFEPKRELHITIISQDAQMLKEHLLTHIEDRDPVQDLVESTDWSFQKLDGLHHAGGEAGEEAIIQLVRLPHLLAFFTSLSKIVHRGFVMPPTHVTLYTRGTEKGISLPNEAVFKQRVKAQIRPDEVHMVQGRPGQAAPGLEQGG